MEAAELRMKNLSDYLNPSEIAVTAVVLDVCFVVCTILLPIIVFLVFRVRSMGKYRWYILNGIVWDYAFVALLGVVKPVAFFPCMGGFSQVGHPTSAILSVCMSVLR